MASRSKTHYVFPPAMSKINRKKTKTMLVSKDVTSTKVSVKIDGDIIKQTDNYSNLYLLGTNYNINWKM